MFLLIDKALMKRLGECGKLVICYKDNIHMNVILLFILAWGSIRTNIRAWKELFPVVISQVSVDLWGHASPCLLTCTYLDRPWTCLQVSPHTLPMEMFTARLQPTPSSTRWGLHRAPGRTATWNRKAPRTQWGRQWSSLKNVISCGKRTRTTHYHPIFCLNIGHV